MKKLPLILASLLVLVPTGLRQAGAQGIGTPPTLTVNLVLSSSKYLLNDSNDPIKAEITIRNTGSQPIITSAGFSQKPFHLFLTITDPDGKPIVAKELQAEGHEGGPPKVVAVNGALVQVEEVDVLAVGFQTIISIPDLNAYYSLIRAGRYSVKAMVLLRTYPSFFNSSGVNYAAIDSFNFAGAVESTTTRFSLITDADGDGYFFPDPPNGAVAPFNVPDCNDLDPSVNPAATEILNDGKDNDCNPATRDALETAAQALQNLINVLNTVFLNNQGRPFTDELAAALDRARRALLELNKTPADDKKAVDWIKQVVDNIAKAVVDGFNAAQGGQIMDQSAGVARQLAVDAIGKAIAQNGNANKIKDAQANLARGDALRAKADFQNAVDEYKKALQDAEQALSGKGK